jgi:hypothetical protein
LAVCSVCIGETWTSILASGAKGNTVTILAIWFGVAVVVGLMLGYAARQLMRTPKGQVPIRRASNTNTDDSGDQHLASSIQSSIKTNNGGRKP